jgi:hypothetical protein
MAAALIAEEELAKQKASTKVIARPMHTFQLI